MIERLSDDAALRYSIQSSVGTANASGVARADSTDDGTHVTRAMVRGFVNSLPANTPDTRRVEIGNAISRGLGLTKRNGLVARADSYFGDLTQRVGVVEQPGIPNVLSSMLPQRQGLSAWAQNVEMDAVSYEGSVALVNGNTTQIPTAGYNASPVLMPVHSFAVRTQIPWQHALYSDAPDALNAVEQNAKAARRAMQFGLEKLIVQGLPGISFMGLHNIPAPAVHSAVDFTSATLDQMIQAIVQGAQAGRLASGDAGMAPNAAFIGSGLLAALDAKSNFSAGGDLTGSEALRRALLALGINRVIRTPSLMGQPSAERDAAIFLRLDDGEDLDGGTLRLVMPMAPAPVKTVELLTSSDTLWAFRFAGLEVVDLTGVALFDAKVR